MESKLEDQQDTEVKQAVNDFDCWILNNLRVNNEKLIGIDGY